MNNEENEVWWFDEPHLTGGDATIKITRNQILKYMKELYHDSLNIDNITDDDLVDQ